MNSRHWLFAAVLAVGAVAQADGSEPRAAEAPIRVAILMFDGVQIIDFAAPYEVFGQAKFAVHTVSRDGGAVTTAMGLKVSVDYGFDDAPAADVLLVPGGDVEAASNDATTLAWIRERAASARQVMSVCTGSDFLARSGLLDGQSATTFHKHFDHFAQQFPKVTLVRDQRWVDAGNIVTSAGLASGIDTALHVVSRLRGEAAARSVALHLEYDWSPDGGFVRGRQADQFIRLPKPEIAFPEHTEFTQVSAIGNEKYWEIDYRVQSSLSPEALLALIATHAEADTRLDVLSLPDPYQLAWQYAVERGGHWRVSLKADPARGSDPFRLVLKAARTH